MNDSTYWRAREEEHIRKQIKSDKQISSEIDRRLQDALSAIQVDIEANWSNYASKEGISVAEAKKRASKMDVEKFSERAKQYVSDKDFSPEANYYLKIYNLTMRISRLELLKSQIGLELVASTDELNRHLSDILSAEAAVEYERQAGILHATLGSNYFSKVESIVRGSHQTATFSENIWRYQAELKAELDKLLVRAITQGKNPREMARDLRKAFDVMKYQAERLMRTEQARIQQEVQKDSYETYGFEEYEFIAEPSACHLCKPLDGKVFKTKNMQPGNNAAPMHPNCRCSTAAYFDRGLNDPKRKASKLLDEARKAEPEITADLKELAESVGTSLDGLDFRLKTLDSLARKVSGEPDGKMRDVVRYTSISDVENMTNDFNKFVEALESKGYNVSAVKNYWNNATNPYNGINCNFYTPQGYEFELQFHTPESFALKNGKLHELYEKYRVIDPLSDEALNLSKEMQQLSETLKRPQGISEIKDVK